MRLNINLATKPYQDIRRLLLQWGGLVLLLAIATIALVSYAISSWRQSRDVNAKIAVVQSEIAALDRQQAEATALLRSPQNATVVENSKFLNALITRKSFSWTRVFMQLEEIMPPRLHVVSVVPELQPKNTVLVHLTVAGTSREAAVELVKRLEQSPSFREARIAEEKEITREKQTTDTIEFQLTAMYMPRAAAEPSIRTAEGSDAAGTPGARVAQTGGTR